MKVDAVVLAGGDGAVIDPQVSVKGLVPVAGRPMVEWVVETLRRAVSVEQIAVVVPVGEGLGDVTELVDHLVVSDGRFADNVIAGTEALGGVNAILVATGDLPALTVEAVEDFVERSLASGADFTYPLVPKTAMLEQFPGSERTFVRIAGGPVTGGNMAMLSPALVSRNREIGQRLFETRKSPVQMARVLGVGFILRLISGRLRPEDVEAKMEHLLGGPCAAIYTDHASIGADVDKPLDVVVAERVMASYRT